MKKTVKLLSVILALALMVSVLAVSALADDPKALADNKATFKSTLTYSGNVKPTLTFAYSISEVEITSEAEGVDTTGYVTGTPTIGEAAFTPDDFESATEVTKNVEVDFSGVTFSVPGNYKYTITQNAPEPAVAGVTYDANPTRYLYVIVTQSASGLSYSYVINDGTAKSEGYANAFDTCDLTITKTVTGNQGDHGKYFKFTVTVTLPAGKAAPYEIVAVSGQVKEPNGTGTGTKYTNDEMASANNFDTLTFTLLSSKVFYLKHGDSLTITGIPKGSSYTVTEDNETYTKTSTGDSSTNIEASATAAFTNNREGEVPTGVVMGLIPGVLLFATGAAGIVLRGRKKED